MSLKLKNCKTGVHIKHWDVINTKSTQTPLQWIYRDYIERVLYRFYIYNSQLKVNISKASIKLITKSINMIPQGIHKCFSHPEQISALNILILIVWLEVRKLHVPVSNSNTSKCKCKSKNIALFMHWQSVIIQKNHFMSSLQTTQDRWFQSTKP